MNETVVTNIVDLNKKPEPKPAIPERQIPDPNEWTPEQEEEAKLVNVEPIITPQPLTMEQLEAQAEIERLMTSQPGINPRVQPPKFNNYADAYFKVADAPLLKKLFEAIHRLVDEVTFKFEPDNLQIRAMDPSRVAMIDYKIDKNYFYEWEVKKTGYACFNIEEVLKVVFPNIKKETVVTMKVDSQEEKLTFILKDSRERTRTFPMLEVEENYQEPPEPKITFNAMFKVVSKAWQDDIKDMQKVADHVQIHIAPEGVKVKGEGDLVKAENKYELGGDILLNVECREYSKSTYSLSYLTDIGVDPSQCDIATLEMTTDMPIRITLHTKFGDLYHYLAPRIETE